MITLKAKMSAQGVTTIRPRRAIVTPRGSPAGGGEVLPLERYVRDLYRTHPTIAVLGASGSGKTTAIQHLAYELGDLPITFIDGEPLASFRSLGALVVTGRTVPPLLVPTLVLQLEPWGESERVDYLLAKHPKQIRSIMKRLEDCDCIDDLEGSPRLWSAILDWMARKDEALDMRHFLRVMTATVLEMFGDDAATFRRLLANAATSPDAGYGFVPAALKHPFVARLALVDSMVQSLLQPNRDELWWDMLVGPEILREAAREIMRNPAAIKALASQIGDGLRGSRATPVGTMLLVDRNFCPAKPPRQMQGLCAPGANWVRVSLTDVQLQDADLRTANLAHSVLERVNLTRANCCRADFTAANLQDACLTSTALKEATFRDAKMIRTSLVGTVATAADFNRAELCAANLTYAKLEGASFIRANLTKAQMCGAIVAATDFTGAQLDFASLVGLDLRDAILNNIQASRADFGRAIMEGMSIERLTAIEARFHGAELTGSRLANAILRGARFNGAGLADIDWEGADLRDADFDNASFHMGSSRSGLVDSPIACEGSRTRFYTDETSETYKRPEEIRKANLCGADLRGAKVDMTDWYLVDLRGARYSTQQAMWFRKCGAILFDRD